MILVLYDNDGTVFTQLSAPYAIPNGGINYLEVEASEGQSVARVDVNVTPHVAILTTPPVDEKQLSINELYEITAELSNLCFIVLEAQAELYEKVLPFLPTPY